MWIKQITEDLTKKYNTRDPFEIAKAKNIYVFEMDLHDEISGFYKYIRRNKFIYLNSNLKSEDKVFTLSHELGHSELHNGVNAPFLKRKTLFSIDKVENEANRFAVELLLSDKAVSEHKDSGMTLNEVASLYCVPKEVTHLKIFNDIQKFNPGGF